MTFSKNEIYDKTLKYFDGDELATKVWIDKYCLANQKGEFLEDSPNMMFERIAKELYRIECTYKNPTPYDRILHLLQDFKYVIPGGSILYGVGNDYSISSLGNCFVIGNDADSYGGIFLSDQEQVQLMKRRGGVGHDLSHIRPKGSPTTNSSKTSTGIVPFMERFSNSTKEVAQDGRRGALMLTFNVTHPEIENFITSKDDEAHEKIRYANISVKVTDEFIQKVKDHKPDAKKIWNKIIHQSWKTAEPGILFWDKIISESPADCYSDFKTKSTNPCGEIPLCPYDSCRLLALNLTSCVINPFIGPVSFDFDQLFRIAYTAQRFMDDIIDLEYEKIIRILKKIESDKETDEIKSVEKTLWEKILKKLNKGRRTGLSGIGLADVFAYMNLKYGSKESLELAVDIYKTIARASYTSSIDMAKERDSFPDFDFFKEQHNPFILRIIETLPDRKRMEYLGFGRRNISNLTIPPSGTISLLAGISSGIEPVFNTVHRRRRKVGDEWEDHIVVHRGFLRWFKQHMGLGAHDNFSVREILNKVSQNGLDRLISRSPYANSNAYEIDSKFKIKLQGQIQKWIDHSISVTTNLPKETTESEVGEILMLAYDSGCKGVTIYREGSRDGILQTMKSQSTKIRKVDAPKRPESLKCDIFYPTIKGEKYIVLIGLLEKDPYEVFCFKSRGIPHKELPDVSTGILKKINRGYYNLLSNSKDILIENITSKFEKPAEEFATRSISTALRHGTPVEFIVEQLNKAEGELFSYSKVIARTLKKYIPEGVLVTGHKCPECDSAELIYTGGCMECTNCGYSKC